MLGLSVSGLRTGPATDKSDRAAAEELLRQAHDLTDIRAEGSAPFRLVARLLVYDAKGQVAEGSYAEIWKTPTSWRRETSYPGFWEARVAAGDTMYISRSQSGPPLDIFELPGLLHLSDSLEITAESSARNLREVGNPSARSLELTRRGKVWAEAYLNASVPLLERIRFHKYQYEFQFEKYKEFEHLRYPTVFTRFSHGKISLRVEVQQLVAETPDDSALAPLKDALALPWCPNPAPAKLEGITVLPAGAVPGNPRDRLVIYGIIGTNGRWHDMTVVSSTGDERAAKRFAQGIQDSQRYTPATCGNRRVAEERVLVANP